MSKPTRSLSRLFTWRSAVCESDLPSGLKLTALVLSLFMNEMGDSAFPAMTTLARLTTQHRATVIRHISMLEHQGWLAVERPAVRAGRGHPNQYRATVPGWVALDDPYRQEGSHGTPGRVAWSVKKGRMVRPEDVSTEDVIEDVDRLSLEDRLKRLAAMKEMIT